MTCNESQWKEIFSSNKKIALLFVGIAALLSAFAVNNKVSTYVDHVQGPAVGDLILDNIPIYDLNFIFFWAVLLFWAGNIIYRLIFPKELPFILVSMSLFVMVRCFFIALTHLGPPENLLIIPDELSYYSFNADLFFSAHVGTPFFYALLTSVKIIKWTAILYSITMVIIVLMSHGHYSIDIFASFFIAHSLSVLMLKIKPKFTE
ncbi:hypothetical protein OAA35_00545 [bacterium]|nr:hypothetical protein [bacterium]